MSQSVQLVCRCCVVVGKLDTPEREICRYMSCRLVLLQRPNSKHHLRLPTLHVHVGTLMYLTLRMHLSGTTTLSLQTHRTVLEGRKFLPDTGL